jgi:hypothetical protein
MNVLAAIVKLAEFCVVFFLGIVVGIQSTYWRNGNGI